MQIIDLTPDRAEVVTEFQSHGAAAQPVADGRGEAHVYGVHVEPGGDIGPHPAGFGQLFCAVSGEGWVAGADGMRHTLRVGQAALIARGEVHAKGSETGMTALMIQVTELAPHGRT